LNNTLCCRNAAGALTAVALVAALLLSAPRAGAFSGQPDATFGQGGGARLGFPGGFNAANAAALQADGRMVVAGTGRNGGWAAGPLMLARYNADASTDTSFGDGGVAWHYSHADSTFEARAVSVLADGRIVVIGNATDGDFFNFRTRLFVARFEANGAPDPTFGSGGLVFPTLWGSNFWGRALFIQADGRLVIAGSAGNSTTHLAIARLNSNGTPDPTFNGSGYKVTPVMDRSGAIAVGLLNGKYVVTGVGYEVNYDSAILVAQFNDNGTLDTAFGGDGVVTTWVGSEAVGLALSFQISTTQPTRIVVAGEANNGTSRSQFVVLRYLPDGSLDTTFDSDGYAVIGVSDFDSGANAVRVLYAGGIATRIVASGYSQTGYGQESKQFAVVKLNLAGSRDATFDGDGIARTTLGIAGATPNAMWVSGSRVTLIGTASGSANDVDVAMARYLYTDGSLDTAFDGDGVRVDDRGLTLSRARDVAVQADGGIVAAGYSRHGGSHGFTAVRFLPDGTLDASFDGDGRLELNFGTYENEVAAVLVEPDGRIVLGGYGVPANSASLRAEFLLTRRMPDGSADPAFGTNGVVYAKDLSGGKATALLRQPDGKLVAAGWVADSEYYCFAAARFETDGRLDTTFGPNGNGFWWTWNNSNTSGVFSEPAAVLQPDGCIILAGDTAGVSQDRDVRLVRLTPDGLKDPTFGTSGIVRTSIGSGAAVARGVAVRPDGRIVVAGWTETGAVTKAFVMRYLPDGTVDPAFGVGGHVILDLGDLSSAGAAMDLELQSDGAIVIAGDGAQGGNTNFAIARLTPDGAVDMSFGSAGQTLFDFPGAGEDKAVALAFDAQGNAILAGSSLLNFAVARILIDPVASAVPETSPGIAGLFLSAPSPNPTSRGAALALELKAGTRTSASVYDVAGRVVRRLFGDRSLEAGRHTLAWDGRDDAGRQVAAGVYYLRLATPGGDETRKVVVVR